MIQFSGTTWQDEYLNITEISKEGGQVPSTVINLHVAVDKKDLSK